MQKRCACLSERAMARGGASLDAARAALGEPPCPDSAHPLPQNPSLTCLTASCPLCRALVTFRAYRALRVVASDPYTSLSWRPSLWSLSPQKVRLDVVDKVPLSPSATAPKARIPGTNVVLRCCALMPGLTWSLLTSPMRVLAGQTGDPLQVLDHVVARKRGGRLRARACGSVLLACHPDVCANGPQSEDVPP